MTHDPMSSDRAVLCARSISLAAHHNQLNIRYEGQPPGGSLTLPRIADTQMDWMRRLATEFHHAHRRCVALALLLDVASGKLTVELPPQTCRPAGAAWRFVDVSGEPDPPLLIGSFCTLPMSESDDLRAEVPPIDGVHLLYDPRRGEEELFAYLRVGGQSSAARLEDLVFSTTQQFMREHADRWVAGGGET